jgi:hypothetical protein
MVESSPTDWGFPGASTSLAWHELESSPAGSAVRHVAVALPRERVLGLTAAVAAVASVLLLLGCGKSAYTLDTGTVERAVAQSILAQRHLYATVDCPASVPRKAGFAFTCTAHLNSGTYPVSVTETSASGRVRYEVQPPVVVLGKAKLAGVEQAIEQSILNQRHLRATVTCPAEVIQRAGVAFTCTATVSGRSYPFAVTEVDGDGHVRYVGLRQSGGSPAAVESSG